MSEILLLYLFTRADAISFTLGLLTFLSAIGTFLGVMITTVHELEKPKLLLQMKWILPILIALAVAAPNSKDLAIIVGGKIAIDVARSEPVSEAASKALELLRAKIDSELRRTKD